VSPKVLERRRSDRRHASVDDWLGMEIFVNRESLK
jgi:hypothetical protein